MKLTVTFFPFIFLPFSCGVSSHSSSVKDADTAIQPLSSNQFRVNQDLVLTPKLLPVSNPRCEIDAHTPVGFKNVEFRSSRVIWANGIIIEGCGISGGFFRPVDMQPTDIELNVDGELKAVEGFPSAHSATPPQPPEKPQDRQEKPDRQGGSSQPANFSQTKSQRYVNRVKSRVVGFRGQCWKYVNDAITGVGGIRMGMYSMAFFRNTSVRCCYRSALYGKRLRGTIPGL